MPQTPERKKIQQREPGQPGSAYPARWPSCALLGESDDTEGGGND